MTFLKSSTVFFRYFFTNQVPPNQKEVDGQLNKGLACLQGIFIAVFCIHNQSDYACDWPGMPVFCLSLFINEHMKEMGQ